MISDLFHVKLSDATIPVLVLYSNRLKLNMSSNQYSDRFDPLQRFGMDYQYKLIAQPLYTLLEAYLKIIRNQL